MRGSDTDWLGFTGISSKALRYLGITSLLASFVFVRFFTCLNYSFSCFSFSFELSNFSLCILYIFLDTFECFFFFLSISSFFLFCQIQIESRKGDCVHWHAWRKLMPPLHAHTHLHASTCTHVFFFVCVSVYTCIYYVYIDIYIQIFLFNRMNENCKKQHEAILHQHPCVKRNKKDEAK